MLRGASAANCAGVNATLWLVNAVVHARGIRGAAHRKPSNKLVSLGRVDEMAAVTAGPVAAIGAINGPHGGRLGRNSAANQQGRASEPLDYF